MMTDKYTAKFDYDATQHDELTLRVGMKITVHDKGSDGWWEGTSENGQRGLFPATYVEPMSPVIPPTQTNGCLHIVQAIYEFTPGSHEELAFRQGERLEVIGMPPADPDWYEARNSSGQVGLIPQNFVLILPNATPESVASQSDEGYNPSQSDVSSDQNANPTNKPWVFGVLERQDAVKILQNCMEKNTFLVRGSQEQNGDITISAKFGETFRHFKVLYREQMYCCGGKKFKTVDDLIHHYTSQKPIYIDKQGQKLYLGCPLPTSDLVIY